MPAQNEKLETKDAVRFLLEECRMVLPGVQALFGFQLIAVFNSTFAEKLGHFEQDLHLFAIGLAALAAALLMTPAAYHRQTNPQTVSQDLIPLFTRLLLYAMFPLLLAVSLDFYLIARLILNDPALSLILALFLAGTYITLWFVLPPLVRLRGASQRAG